MSMKKCEHNKKHFLKNIENSKELSILNWYYFH